MICMTVQSNIFFNYYVNLIYYPQIYRINRHMFGNRAIIAWFIDFPDIFVSISK